MEFQGRRYYRHKNYWFVWEPAWDSFRPIDGVRWNGTSYVIDDSSYCSDPLSEYYGFGSPQMKQVCELLQPTEFKKAYAIDTGNGEWFRDRFVPMTHYAPRDKQSWKRMVQGKHRTCRHAPRGKKLTRRNL